MLQQVLFKEVPASCTAYLVMNVTPYIFSPWISVDIDFSLIGENPIQDSLVFNSSDMLQHSPISDFLGWVLGISKIPKKDNILSHGRIWWWWPAQDWVLVIITYCEFILFSPFLLLKNKQPFFVTYLPCFFMNMENWRLFFWRVWWWCW